MSQRRPISAPGLPSLSLLEAAWGRGLLSDDELQRRLLRHLLWLEERQNRQHTPAAGKPSSDRAATAAEIEQLSIHNATLQTQVLVLNGLLHQLGEAVDGLTRDRLDLWRTDGRWYWRWDDTGTHSPHGLRSCGEALVDAVEQRAGLTPNDELPSDSDA